MYSSLAEFKNYIWVYDDSIDSQLLLFLNSANSLLNKLLNIDSFDEWIIDENIKLDSSFSWSFSWSWLISIYLRNKPVKEILEINDSVYSWNYLIVNDRKIIFNDNSLYSKINSFWFIKVKYRYWYNRGNTWEWIDELPYDIKLMEMMLASWFYQNKWFEWVNSYKLWDEQIVFWNNNWISSDNMFFKFKCLYDKRKCFNLPM